ncbi:hypothetical protein [Amycolatopsis sp. NPDC059021]|uniref:WXG100-like domain-containing protein n=1 Tax=Amycolatopsis sp. NPDC059021 TaxID=3346704 RepID=UPI00366E86E9
MSLMINEQGITLFKVLTGTEWPTADEDKLREVAALYRQAGENFPRISEQIRKLTDAIGSDFNGQAGAAFADRMRQLITKNDKGVVPLEAAEKAVKAYGEYAEKIATQVEYMKYSAIIQLVLIPAQIAAAYAMAPVTAGLSLLLIPTIKAVGSMILRFLLNLLLETIVSVAMAVLAAVLADVIAQEIQIGQGHRNKFDFESLENAVKSGALSGSLGGVASMGAKALGDTLAKLVTKDFGKFLTESIKNVFPDSLKDFGEQFAKTLTKYKTNITQSFGDEWSRNLPKSEAKSLANDLTKVFDKSFENTLTSAEKKALGKAWSDTFTSNVGHVGKAGLQQELKTALQHFEGKIGSDTFKALTHDVPEVIYKETSEHLKGSVPYQILKPVAGAPVYGAQGYLGEGLNNLAFSDEHQFKANWWSFTGGAVSGAAGDLMDKFMGEPLADKLKDVVENLKTPDMPDVPKDPPGDTSTFGGVASHGLDDVPHGRDGNDFDPSVLDHFEPVETDFPSGHENVAGEGGNHPGNESSTQDKPVVQVPTSVNAPATGSGHSTGPGAPRSPEPPSTTTPASGRPPAGDSGTRPENHGTGTGAPTPVPTSSDHAGPEHRHTGEEQELHQLKNLEDQLSAAPPAPHTPVTEYVAHVEDAPVVPHALPDQVRLDRLHNGEHGTMTPEENRQWADRIAEAGKHGPQHVLDVMTQRDERYAELANEHQEHEANEHAEFTEDFTARYENLKNTPLELSEEDSNALDLLAQLPDPPTLPADDELAERYRKVFGDGPGDMSSPQKAYEHAEKQAQRSAREYERKLGMTDVESAKWQKQKEAATKLGDATEHLKLLDDYAKRLEELRAAKDAAEMSELQHRLDDLKSVTFAPDAVPTETSSDLQHGTHVLDLLKDSEKVKAPPDLPHADEPLPKPPSRKPGGGRGPSDDDLQARLNRLKSVTPTSSDDHEIGTEAKPGGVDDLPPVPGHTPDSKVDEEQSSVHNGQQPPDEPKTHETRPAPLEQMVQRPPLEEDREAGPGGSVPKPDDLDDLFGKTDEHVSTESVTSKKTVLDDLSWQHAPADRTADWFAPRDPAPPELWEHLRESTPPRTVTTESTDVASSSRIKIGENGRPHIVLDSIAGMIGYDHRRYTLADGRAVQEFTVRVHLDPAAGVTAAHLAGTKQKVLDGVGRLYNRGYRLPSGDQFHVHVEFTDQPGAAHARVRLRHRGTTDQAHWSVGDSGTVLAHEIGHYLGLPDEYVDPSQVLQGSRVHTDTSLMGTAALGDHAKLLPRHLWLVEHVANAALPVHPGPSQEVSGSREVPQRTFEPPQRAILKLHGLDMVAVEADGPETSFAAAVTKTLDPASSAPGPDLAGKSLKEIAEAAGARVHVLEADGTFTAYGRVAGVPVHVVRVGDRYHATKEIVHIGRPGISYPGPAKMAVEHGSPTVHRGEFEVETIAGKHYVRMYTAVVHPELFSGDQVRPKTEHKDIQQDPKTGRIKVSPGRNSRLWVGAGRPLRALQWLTVYQRDEGGKRLKGESSAVVTPVLRSFLIPYKKTYQAITDGAVVEGVGASAAAGKTFNVDQAADPNQFGVGGVDLDKLIERAVRGSLISYTATGTEFPKGGTSGRELPMSTLHERLGLSRDFRSDVFGEDYDPWFKGRDEKGKLKFSNDPQRLREIAVELREHVVTWEQMKQAVGERRPNARIEPDADSFPGQETEIPQTTVRGFEERVRRLNQFLNKVGPGAAMVGKVSDKVLLTAPDVLREYLADTAPPDVDGAAFHEVLGKKVLPDVVKAVTKDVDTAIRILNNGTTVKDETTLERLIKNGVKVKSGAVRTFDVHVVDKLTDTFVKKVRAHPALALFDDASREAVAEAVKGGFREALTAEFGKLRDFADFEGGSGKKAGWLSGDRLVRFGDQVREQLALPEVSGLHIVGDRFADMVKGRVLGSVVTHALDAFTGRDLTRAASGQLKTVIKDEVLPKLAADIADALRTSPELALADKGFRDLMARAVADEARARSEQALDGFVFDPVDATEVEQLMDKAPEIATQAEIGFLIAADSKRIAIDFNTRLQVEGNAPFPNEFAEWNAKRDDVAKEQRAAGRDLDRLINGGNRDPHAIVDKLIEYFPELGRKFDEVATKQQLLPERTEKGTYTFYEHAQMVLGQYFELTAHEDPEQRLVPADALAKAILFHDIEKVNAKNQFGNGQGQHDREPEHKLAVQLMDRYRHLWGGDAEFRVVRAMVDSDPFGFYLRGKIDADEVFRFVHDLAATLSPAPDAARRLFEEFHQYYQADFSSYTVHSGYVDRDGVRHEGPNSFTTKFARDDDGIVFTADHRHFAYAESALTDKIRALAGMFATGRKIVEHRERIRIADERARNELLGRESTDHEDRSAFRRAPVRDDGGADDEQHVELTAARERWRAELDAAKAEWQEKLDAADRAWRQVTDRGGPDLRTLYEDADRVRRRQVEGAHQEYEARAKKADEVWKHELDTLVEPDESAGEPGPVPATAEVRLLVTANLATAEAVDGEQLRASLGTAMAEAGIDERTATALLASFSDLELKENFTAFANEGVTKSFGSGKDAVEVTVQLGISGEAKSAKSGESSEKHKIANVEGDYGKSATETASVAPRDKGVSMSLSAGTGTATPVRTAELSHTSKAGVSTTWKSANTMEASLKSAVELTSVTTTTRHTLAYGYTLHTFRHTMADGGVVEDGVTVTAPAVTAQAVTAPPVAAAGAAHLPAVTSLRSAYLRGDRDLLKAVIDGMPEKSLVRNAVTVLGSAARDTLIQQLSGKGLSARGPDVLAGHAITKTLTFEHRGRTRTATLEFRAGARNPVPLAHGEGAAAQTSGSKNEHAGTQKSKQTLDVKWGGGVSASWPGIDGTYTLGSRKDFTLSLSGSGVGSDELTMVHTSGTKVQHEAITKGKLTAYRADLEYTVRLTVDDGPTETIVDGHPVEHGATVWMTKEDAVAQGWSTEQSTPDIVEADLADGALATSALPISPMSVLGAGTVSFPATALAGRIQNLLSGTTLPHRSRQLYQPSHVMVNQELVKTEVTPQYLAAHAADLAGNGLSLLLPAETHARTSTGTEYVRVVIRAKPVAPPEHVPATTTELKTTTQAVTSGEHTSVMKGNGTAGGGLGAALPTFPWLTARTAQFSVNGTRKFGDTEVTTTTSAGYEHEKSWQTATVHGYRQRMRYDIDVYGENGKALHDSLTVDAKFEAAGGNRLLGATPGQEPLGEAKLVDSGTPVLPSGWKRASLPDDYAVHSIELPPGLAGWLAKAVTGKDAGLGVVADHLVHTFVSPSTLAAHLDKVATGTYQTSVHRYGQGELFTGYRDQLGTGSVRMAFGNAKVIDHAESLELTVSGKAKSGHGHATVDRSVWDVSGDLRTNLRVNNEASVVPQGTYTWTSEKTHGTGVKFEQEASRGRTYTGPAYLVSLDASTVLTGRNTQHTNVVLGDHFGKQAERHYGIDTPDTIRLWIPDDQLHQLGEVQWQIAPSHESPSPPSSSQDFVAVTHPGLGHVAVRQAVTTDLLPAILKELSTVASPVLPEPARQGFLAQLRGLAKSMRYWLFEPGAASLGASLPPHLAAQLSPSGLSALYGDLLGHGVRFAYHYDGPFGRTDIAVRLKAKQGPGKVAGTSEQWKLKDKYKAAAEHAGTITAMTTNALEGNMVWSAFPNGQVQANPGWAGSADGNVKAEQAATFTGKDESEHTMNHDGKTVSFVHDLELSLEVEKTASWSRAPKTISLGTIDWLFPPASTTTRVSLAPIRDAVRTTVPETDALPVPGAFAAVRTGNVVGLPAGVRPMLRTDELHAALGEVLDGVLPGESSGRPPPKLPIDAGGSRQVVERATGASLLSGHAPTLFGAKGYRIGGLDLDRAFAGLLNHGPLTAITLHAELLDPRVTHYAASGTSTTGKSVHSELVESTYTTTSAAGSGAKASGSGQLWSAAAGSTSVPGETGRAAFELTVKGPAAEHKAAEPLKAGGKTEETEHKSSGVTYLVTADVRWRVTPEYRGKTVPEQWTIPRAALGWNAAVFRTDEAGLRVLGLTPPPDRSAESGDIFHDAADEFDTPQEEFHDAVEQQPGDVDRDRREAWREQEERWAGWRDRGKQSTVDEVAARRIATAAGLRCDPSSAAHRRDLAVLAGIHRAEGEQAAAEYARGLWQYSGRYAAGPARESVEDMFDRVLSGS